MVRALARTNCHLPADWLTQPSPADEFSLYLHLPFCQKKCPYCNFFVLPPTSEKMKELCEALISEWKQIRPMTKNRRLRSIYFGGGTPSLFPTSLFQQLFDVLQPSTEVEVTIEVNPEQATPSFFSDMRSLGINRISLGAQSLLNNALRLLGRNHTAFDIEGGIKAACDAGFDNISLDLMYELPDQTPKQWLETLDRVATWPIQHLSFYNLIIEPKTPFYRNRNELLERSPTSQHRASMLEMIGTQFQGTNWKQYEISAISRPGFESLHNTGYWTGRFYLGLGPSAHSFWDGKRWKNGENWAKYLVAASRDIDRVRVKDVLGEKDRQRELFLIHLRVTSGVNLTAFKGRWGRVPFFFSQFKSLIERGLMELKGQVLFLTPKGRRYYDAIAVELI